MSLEIWAYIVRVTQPKVPGGYDAPIHISEEASNASTAVPISIVASFSVAVLLGFGKLSPSILLIFHNIVHTSGVNFALAFNMGTDVQAVIDSPIGQPMAAVSKPELDVAYRK